MGIDGYVFDWCKAALLIRQYDAKYAIAGLDEDWESTFGEILIDGKIPEEADCHCYVSSTWATPQLRLPDKHLYFDCFQQSDDISRSAHYWTAEALAILKGGGDASETN